jgi:hypothetical protein
MRKLTIVLSGAVLLVMLAGLSTHLKHSRIDGALATGRLSPLPAGAHAVQVDTEGNLFARSFWVAFEAPTQDIQLWIRQSPALAKGQPSACARPVIFGERPPWFRPTSIRNGLLYQIPQDSLANYGTVWIDQEANIVYIKTSHS